MKIPEKWQDIKRAQLVLAMALNAEELAAEFAAVREEGYLVGLQEGYRSAIEVQLYRACVRLLTYWLTGAREAMTEDAPKGKKRE
jgi:hypothetical protein